jgi:RNA polymerase sigma-70 factor (ECF subfamily)
MASGLVGEAEAGLITRAQHGDLHAFEEIVHRYRQGMIDLVSRMCGDIYLAEDAAQSAFIKVWQRLPDYRATGSFRSWLYRIAVNAALDVLRREKPTHELDQMPNLSGPEDPEDVLEQRQQQEHIRQAVLSLPSASLSVLVLREYEGFSYQEIAQALEIPVGTVMSRLNYARNRLAEILSPYLEES